MKSFTTGVSVRFLSVIIPTGQREIGSSTGTILSRGRLAPNCSNDAGRIPRKRPLGRIAQTREADPHMTPFGGKLTPRARNASAIRRPIADLCGGNTQGSSANSESTTFLLRAHLLLAPATTLGRS